MKRDIVTAVIYCYITTAFHYAKRDSRCLSLLGFSPYKFWQALVYLSKYLTLLNHFDEPKNLLELPHPTRNIRKCSNKLMTHTSGEINLQSKQDIICHIAKVKPATSAHYGADVIPLLAYAIHRMQIWRTTQSAPGTSSTKVRLVRSRCFVLTMLPLKSLASWMV